MSGGMLTGREWIDDWKRRADLLRENTERMAEGMGRLNSTAYNADNNIRVTVDSQGTLSDLRFKDGVQDMPADRIAAEVVSTMRAAQKKLLQEARDVVASTVGGDSETGKAVVSSLEKQLRGTS